jgi:leucyl aminopeptidase
MPNVPAERVLLVGCGQENELTSQTFRTLLSKTFTALKANNSQEAICYLTDVTVKNQNEHFKLRTAIEAAEDVFYSFDQFKSKKPAKNPIKLTKLTFNSAQPKTAERAIQEAQAITTGIKLVKDLGNMPGNICTPTYLAKQAQQLAKQYRLKIQVLEESEMRKLGMGALLAVASGSEQPAKLIVLHYQGARKTEQPIALVGKGITFDSGGISLKPGLGMEEMKFDMCGAASVLGTFKAVAELKLPINLVGIIPTTENLPSGTAVKPGDVVTTMSGQTIEILNTDAEGRLILSDALTYCQKFNPRAIIDMATLTGAIIIALGNVASGAFTNNEALLTEIQKAANDSNDRIWPLPMWEDYQEQIDSKVADMMNIGVGGGKSITAACLLARFVKNVPWVHLDIAGTAWKTGQTNSATGRPVPLLVQYLLNNCR